MGLKLFSYAVIVHEYEPSKDGLGEVFKDSKIIIEPTTVLAKMEKDVIFKVTRLIPEQYASNPDNVEILIRPF